MQGRGMPKWRDEWGRVWRVKRRGKDRGDWGFAR